MFRHRLALAVTLVFFMIPAVTLAFSKLSQKVANLQAINIDLKKNLAAANQSITEAQKQISILQNEDLRKTNSDLKTEINQLKDTFKSASISYEDLLKLRDRSGARTGPIEVIFADILNFLAKDDLKNTNESLKKIAAAIDKEESRLAAIAITIPANVTAVNQAPGSGYRRQKVTVDGSDFLVDIVAADLNSTRVIIDTASDGTCANNCPVLPLATYVSRSGAYAGINGTYFCPDTYPSCADKKNSFDTLVMNKNKVYFNSDNNVYSNVPVAVFYDATSRFIGAASGWGRATDIDAVISNRPLLVQDGNIAFGGGGESKETIRGSRSFLGGTGNMGYIGVVHSATVAEAAKVIWTMGIKGAINLDDGGSVALWSGGYKVGPGRNLPNVVLFVRK